jgi:hypothetical protein
MLQWTQLHGNNRGRGPAGLATAASLFFFVGVFFNNVSISTNDYTVVVCIAEMGPVRRL